MAINILAEKSYAFAGYATCCIVGYQGQFPKPGASDFYVS